jgi:alkanesulfonate monooxygenase SsuD/methylene tetrahydromethanopterin reductase-like flavin-dependent oxidoreductase (luciferase family)
MSGSTRYGVFLNNRGAVFLGSSFTLTRLVALAVRAERLGFDFVSVGDSILAKPRFAPIPTLAAVAVLTERVELTTGILQPHLRPPVQLAQEWATLDALSGGRTSLGVGLGTGPRSLVDAELALVGLTRARRARAFEESIMLLRQLWTSTAPCSFEGHVFRLDAVDVGFRPVRAGGVPVLIACGAYIPMEAGFGPNDVYRKDVAGSILGPLDRVVRLGDGWITGVATPLEWLATWQRLCEAGERAGRLLDVPAFERRFNTYINVGRDRASARAEGKAFLEDYHRLPMDDGTLDRWLICGEPGECSARIAELEAVGVNAFQFVLASPDQERQLEALADSVLPRVGVSAALLGGPGG